MPGPSALLPVSFRCSAPDRLGTVPACAHSAATPRRARERLRHAVSLASGANDGLSYLIVFLPFPMLTRPASEALSHWMLHTVLLDVVAVTAFGLLLPGYLAGKLLRWSERHDAIQPDSRLVYAMAVALLAIGAGRLIGCDEVLVVFAASAAFAEVVDRENREEEDRGQAAVNRCFAIPIFAVLGATIPWAEW